jgi:ABC-type multidrug transport system ATPase subunit
VVQRGRQLAEGTPAQLKAGLRRRVVLRVRATTPELLARVRAVPGVAEVDARDGHVGFLTPDPEQGAPAVVRAAVAAGADVLGLAEEQVSLEEAYLNLVRAAP